MKILFLGAGRRVTLAEMFSNRGFEVYSYEVDLFCPISTSATVISGLRWDDDSIADHIAETIKVKKIDLILPLQDEAIEICSKIPNAVCSDFTASKTCYNKKMFEEFMLSNFSEIYPCTNDHEKTIEKHMYGYASRGIKIHDSIVNYKDDCIYQSFKTGKEYTVDAYFDKNSNFVNACPRLRIRVADGEVVDSRVQNFKELCSHTKIVGERLGLIGPICAQYIVQPDGKIYLFEINARFGGGSTLSIHAGFDMIDMIKKEYILKNNVCSSDYHINYGTYMRRFFKDVYWA